MNPVNIRSIPGYESYGVDEYGVVVNLHTLQILPWYSLDGYLIVDAFYESLTETLPVHRAVALAWVPNPDPSRFQIVNHLDGNRMNNHYSNLEWTDYSGNNYHAVNNGLRRDNIPCKVRDFETGMVTEFSSVAQAAEFMGLRKDAPVEMIFPKMFGKLVNGRFEFRYLSDTTPWFYEQRSTKVNPSRYMVSVREPDGRERELFSNAALMKEYQLYDSPSKSIPALVEHAQAKYPNYNFSFRDSYTEERFVANRATEASRAIGVKASNGFQQLDFPSLTKCAQYFNVDRSVIASRLGTGVLWNGWTFSELPH